jgi:excinuclease ABC subunit C
MSLQETVRSLPDAPGVYLFKDARGRVLYIGKALSLRKRVQSYLHADGASEKVAAFLPQVRDVEVILTDSELEALILESNLIKEKRPRYNVVLRDDKHYPFLKLDLKDAWPRLQVVRRIKEDGALYFGPYVPAGVMWRTLGVLNKTFPFRKCRSIQGRRLCLDYHLGRCLGPCEGKADRQEYDRVIERVRLVLEGKDRELTKDLEQGMEAAAERLEFERAARLRDQLSSLRQATAGQKVLSATGEDQDVFGLALEGGEAQAELLLVRRGKVVGHEAFPLGRADGEAPGSLLASLVKQFYVVRQGIPREVLVSHPLEDAPLIEEWLARRAGAAVSVHAPQRGRKARLVALAVKNAALALQQSLGSARGREAALSEVQALLNLPRPPHRLECVDISNIRGTHAVAALVVFEAGVARRAAYRRYRIKTVTGADDVRMMGEVLRRRLARRAEQPLPDLLLLDGGVGQLNVGLQVLREAGCPDQPLAALAKEREEVYLPGRARPVALPEGSRARHLLQQVRDEAHRFAVSYHRRVRGRAAVTSVLEEIPGLGPKRKAQLLERFGSVRRLRAASVDEITRLGGIPPQVAATIHDFLAAVEEVPA